MLVVTLQRQLGVEQDSEVIENLNVEVFSPSADHHPAVAHAERHDAGVLQVLGSQRVRLSRGPSESAHDEGGLGGG